MNPWPGAFFIRWEENKKVWKATPVPGQGTEGVVAGVTSEGIIVGTAQDRLLIEEVQAPGKKRISAAEFARGRHLRAGDSLGF
jgi:methionyl-tRNA formyltransferase